MKQYLLYVFILGLCVTSLGLAEMHRAIWDDGGKIWYQVHNIGPGTARAGHQASLSIDGVPTFNDLVPVDLAPGERYAAPIAVWSCSGASDDLQLTADYSKIIEGCA